MNSYNGYTAAERNRKLQASKKRFPNRTHPCFRGPCHLCGDPESPVAPHSEDYSEPYRWERPAVYALCKTCHSRLHKRFANPSAWEAYKLHLKRGGYGKKMTPQIKREVRRATLALERGKPPTLEPLGPFTATDLWWDALTTDPASLAAAWARPR